MYGIAFTIKMSKKGDHQIDVYFDYVVPPLEGFWWQKGVANISEDLIMNNYIAYCGLDCEICEARLATVNNDNDLRIKVSKEWSELNGVEITPEMINCSGCRIPGVKTVYCDSLCPIRQCAREKQMETCGGCQEMRSCEMVGAIIGNNPDARDRLERTRVFLEQ